MQSFFDIPADLDTPVSAYLKLAPFGSRFLLESVGGAGREARYSFLGFGEAEEVRLDAERIGNTQAGPLIADRQRVILDAFRAALAKAPRLDPGHSPTDEVPFRGGLVGAAGFGLARSLEGLERVGRPEAPPDYLGFAPRSVLVFDHETRRMGLLASSDQDREGLRREVLKALAGPLPEQRRDGKRKIDELTSSMTQAEYEAGVEAAQRSIRAGEVYQLVLSQRFSGACDLEPIAVYRALRLLDPSPYLFLLEFSDTAIIGASPEALVRVEGGRAFTQPIAGTRPRGCSAQQDLELERELLADPKEAAEHVMLVDLARSDLGRIATPGSVVVEPYRQIKRYREVMHIVSGVRAELDRTHEPVDAFDVFGASFPAGTVVGAPKVRAMELLHELEPISRDLYAGAIGTFGHGATDDPSSGTANQAIAIRTAVLRGGTVSVQAGAGIVLDSKPEKEHEEVLAKARGMRAALALAAEDLS